MIESDVKQFSYYGKCLSFQRIGYKMILWSPDYIKDITKPVHALGLTAFDYQVAQRSSGYEYQISIMEWINPLSPADCNITKSMVVRKTEVNKVYETVPMLDGSKEHVEIRSFSSTSDALDSIRKLRKLPNPQHHKLGLVRETYEEIELVE